MKLIIAIVREKFFDKLLVELMEADVHVTKLNSTGGFFKKSNTTLLIGTESKDLDKIDKIFKANCKTEILEKDGKKVEVAGATTFILDVADCLRI